MPRQGTVTAAWRERYRHDAGTADLVFTIKVHRSISVFLSAWPALAGNTGHRLIKRSFLVTLSIVAATASTDNLRPGYQGDRIKPTLRFWPSGARRITGESSSVYAPLFQGLTTIINTAGRRQGRRQPSVFFITIGKRSKCTWKCRLNLRKFNILGDIFNCISISFMVDILQ